MNDLLSLAERCDEEMVAYITTALTPDKSMKVVQGMRRAAAEWAIVASALRARHSLQESS